VGLHKDLKNSNATVQFQDLCSSRKLLLIFEKTSNLFSLKIVDTRVHYSLFYVIPFFSQREPWYLKHKNPKLFSENNLAFLV